MKTLQIILFTTLMMFSRPTNAQPPFIALFAEEVSIPASTATSIHTALNSGSNLLPRCYRIYICCSETNWELQAMYGGDGFSAWTMNSTLPFYQNPFGSHVGSGINNSLFGLFPELAFDSWFTINATNSAATTNLLSFQATPPAFSDWETTGGNFNSGTTFGSAITNLPSYPNSTGMPDALNRILIAQVTTEGIPSCNFNLQFRKMNPNGTPFVPITTVQINNAIFDLSVGSVTPCSLILPLTFLSIECASMNHDVEITWRTSRELNNDHFEVQHSTNNFEWEHIHSVPAANDNYPVHNYSFIHKDPNPGLNYYRVKQIDHNGISSDSDITSIVVQNSEIAAITIYPNPTISNTINLLGDLTDVSSIKIISPDGKTVYQQGSPIQNHITFGSALSPGLYFVEIDKISGEKSVLRIIFL